MSSNNDKIVLDDRDSFDKLTETNYHEWATFMEARLLKRELWNLVNGTLLRPTGPVNSVRAWDRRRDEAYAEIVLHVSASQLAHITTRDPVAIWTSFAQLHGTRGFSSQLALRRRLITMRKSNNQSITSWIADIRRVAYALSRAGASVSDTDLILILTAGLPISYNSLIVNLDAVDPALLTLNYVITRLLSEESRQSVNPPARNETALAVSTIRKKTPLDRITCFNCNEKGHYQSSCNKPKRSPIGHSAEHLDSTYVAIEEAW